MSTIERRKAKRREILTNFSFYICLPKLGYTRHRVHDVSELGIGFEIETMEGEFKLKMDEQCELQFYLNQSLYLSMNIQVVRQKQKNDIQENGAVFLDTSSNQYQTFLTLVKLVDQLSEFGEIARP